MSETRQTCPDCSGPLMLYEGNTYYLCARCTEKRAKAAEARAKTLAEALRKLRNESAALAFRKGEIIEAISQTNWDCLQLRIAQADAALAAQERKDE